MAQRVHHQPDTVAATGKVQSVKDTLAPLSGRVSVRRPDEVSQYLKKYPHLVPVVIEAANVIPSYFGTGATIILEMFYDPEWPEDEGYLFAHIQVPAGITDAFARFIRLGDEWWLDAMPPLPGVLVMNYEVA